MVIVITGPIASGKSTVARALVGELAGLDVRAAVIDLDIVEAMLTSGGPRTDQGWTLARRATATLANTLLSDGVTVVIADGSFNRASDRAVFESHLDPTASPLYVTLSVTFEEALRRAQGDPTRGVSRDPAFLGAHFAARAEALGNLPASDVVIDTASTSPTTAAAEIAQLMRGEKAIVATTASRWPARRRWDDDERGRGVASGAAFSAHVAELADLMADPGWVAEEPDVHLLPHLLAACAEPGSLLRLDAAWSDAEMFVVELTAVGAEHSVGQLRHAAVALIAAIAEESTHILQRRDGDVVEFDVATGSASAEAEFAPHGHLVRLRIRSGA